MLSNLFLKRGAAIIAKPTGIRSFALDASHLQKAARDPAHLNWSQFFAGARASDVAGSDVQSVANLLKVLSHLDAESKEARENEALFKAVDEYFRLKFRKMQPKEALDIMLPLGEDTEHKLAVMDDKFWLWETVDEALRPVISDLPEEQIISLMKAFGANYKGSEDLWDYLMQKVHYHGAQPF